MNHECKSCAYFEQTTVFELCKHPTSHYAVAGREDFHTIGHMRTRECGAEGRNFRQAATVLGR